MVSERNKKEMEEEREKHIYPRLFLVTVQYNIKLFEENQIKYTSVSPNHVVCDVNFWYHRQLNHQQEASPRNFNQS